MSKKATASASALDAQTKAFVEEWRGLTASLETMKARELEIRNYLAAVFFKTPEEGVNRILTEDGFEFVLDHKINRKLDEPALDSVMQALPEDSPFRQLGVLIEYKPKLVLKGLRAMPEDQKLIFAQALTETPGTPSLVINLASESAGPASDPATAPASPDWPATLPGVLTGASGAPTTLDHPAGAEPPEAPEKPKRTRKSSSTKTTKSKK